jgi:LPXTG-motif cell wall-anchored protein
MLAIVPATAGAVEAAGCGASPAANGTGYRPPSNRSSLPSATEQPGPELLYRDLATSPQLENTGPWRAAPLMVSGVRGYREGEFVYQDFLYDDTALTYPADPANAGNAADLVEVRLRMLPEGLGVRLTYNAMIQPDVGAATLALGSSAAAFPLPHDAGASSRGEVFVTVHGCTGDAVRASDGKALGNVQVATDLRRRQVDVRIPYSVYDPRATSAFEVRAAAGLWDAAAGTYQRPDSAAPAFFNVGFRVPGAYANNSFMDESQNAALDAKDLSPLFATVEVAKLVSGRRDDLVDKPGGMPSKGPMNRIHVSHFEPKQGRGSTGVGNHDKPCEPPECTYLYSGRLQPYTVVVPDAPPPSSGYPLTVSLHGSGENHNANENDILELLANAGRPTLVVAPLGRGPSFWWFALGAADVYEAWADAAAHYRLDPRYVVQSGQSMGGYGAYKLASTYPDLYTGAFPSVGPGAPTLDAVPGAAPVTPRTSDVWKLFASLRHVPVLSVNAIGDPIVPITTTRNNMQVLEDLDYRYDFYFFGASSHSDHRYLVPEEYVAMAKAGPIDRDPRRVTYVVNAAMSNPELGLSADRAYWVSGLRLADSAAAFGTVDVVSRGFPAGDPQVGSQESTQGVAMRGPDPYERLRRQWGTTPVAATADVLDITATNVSSVTVDVDRARLSCRPRINVTSDVPVKVKIVGRSCAARSAAGPGNSGAAAGSAGSVSEQLPATGSGDWPAAAGLLLVAGAALLHRRRRVLVSAPRAIPPTRSALTAGRPDGHSVRGPDAVEATSSARIERGVVHVSAGRPRRDAKVLVMGSPDSSPGLG